MATTHPTGYFGCCILSFAVAFVSQLAGCSQESNRTPPLLEQPATICVATAGAAEAEQSAGAASGGISIVSYGPVSAAAGVPFDRQPNGQSAVWIKLDLDIQGGVATVVFGGRALKTSMTDDLVTALVPASAYIHAGKYPLYVKGSVAGRPFQTQVVFINVH